MTNRDLQIFMMVAECGRMSETAKRLFITQSSVSQAISSIEKEYDILLFERLSHSLYLTRAGQELLSYAQSLFSIRGDMEEFLRSKSEARGIRVGATITVGTCVISPILLRLNERIPSGYSEVHVENTHILEDMLIKNQIDIGLVEGRVTHPDLTVVNSIPDEMVLICSPTHSFRGRDTVQAAELEREPLIMREQGSGTRAQFEEQMALHKLKHIVRWSCCNSEAIKKAVMDGHGVSVISERLVRAEVASGQLWAAHVSDLELERYFALVYHKNKYFTEALKAFVTCCEEFAQAEKEKRVDTL